MITSWFDIRSRKSLKGFVLEQGDSIPVSMSAGIRGNISICEKFSWHGHLLYFRLIQSSKGFDVV